MEKSIPGEKPHELRVMRVDLRVVFGAPRTLRIPPGIGSALHDEADAAGRVTRGVQYSSSEASPSNRVAFLQKILQARGRRSRNAEPLRLDIKMVIELEVFFMD